MRNLAIKGKIVIFKTILISKIVLQSFIITVPNSIVNELEKGFSQKNSTPKIRHETLCSDFNPGGFKNVDIQNEIVALQWSWIRRLYDDSFHEWKLIPLYLIEKSFGTSFKFHSNLLFKSNKIKFFPYFSSEIVLNWKKYLAIMAEMSSCTLSQYLWYNESNQVNKACSFLKFSGKSINYVSQLFSDKGSIKN